MAKNKITNEQFFNLNTCCSDPDFWNLYSFYKQLDISLIEYDNLPSGLTSEIIERMFFDYGSQLFLERKINNGTATIGTGNYIVLAPSGQYNFNLYSMPTKFSGYGLNYYVTDKTLDEAVWMRNNIDALSDSYVVWYYCTKMAEVKKCIDMCLNAQKLPIMLRSFGRENILTLENIFKQIDANIPVIKVSKSLDLKDIEVLQLNAPYIIDKLQIHLDNLTRELHTRLGINNLPLEKNERLISGEVESNDILISDVIGIKLKMRKEAVKRINELFGLNISVRFKNEPKPIETEKEVDDGEVYADTELSDKE